MDEGKDEENNNETVQASWWGSWPSWLQTAKDKSNTAFEFMKRDLTEFSQVVQIDAVAAVSSTAAMLKDKLSVNTAESVANKARESISSVLGTISDVFVPQRELEDEELMIIRDLEPVALDWWQSKLYVIRNDPKTYCHEPEGPPEMYENWLESFHPDDHEEEMTEIMMTCSEVRALYDKLVPDAVSHLEFWQRYFYRVHLLRKAEAKRADLMRRAEQISIEDVEWGEGDILNETDPVKSQTKVQTDQVIRDTSEKTVTPKSDAPRDQSKAKTLSSCDMIENVQNIPTDTSAPESSAKMLGGLRDAADIISETNSETTAALETFETKVEMAPSAVTDDNRSSPVESLGKDSSTGDDWEKDFDLELTENNLIQSDNLPSEQQLNPQKEDEDDWENWK